MRAVNLIPSDDRGGASITAGRSGGGVLVVIGLLAGLAVFALLYGLANHKISGARSEVASLTARARQTQARAGELSPYTTFLQMREQRTQAVTALVDSRFDWARAFHELGRVLPTGKVSLDSIEGTIGAAAITASSPAAATTTSAASGSAVTSATPPGSIPIFKLTGCAVSQAEVALMLERLRLIDGVSEVSLQSSTQASSSGAGGSAEGGCQGGNPTFTTQVTFDALPAVPTPSSGATAATVASSTSASTPASPAPASAPASTATTPAAPAASTASASSSGAVR
jgi:Tfp pilus assembly protein PilN